MIKTPYYTLLFIIYLCACSIQAQTTVQEENGNWSLLVDGAPYEIKGITFGYDQDIANYDTYFQDLKSIGVNTIRTWATGENTPQLLDAAHKHDIKIMIGIWMRHGRPGMEDDDHFNYLEDTAGIEVMYTNAINTVRKYKDHPAVLTWGIGNEVYLNTATDAEKEAYSKTLERICSDIKQLDTNHPITSIEAWTFGLDWWQKYVPSIDIYGVNTYGPGANIIADEFKKKGVEKPYVITEFGVTGEWDAQEDTNGVKIEPNDRQKYNAIASGYHNWIINKPSNLGVYFFHYSDGNQFIAPWLFTHYKGAYRSQYWAVREAYTGKLPINHTPVITSFTLPDEKIQSGTWIPVAIDVSDPEQEELTVSFSYNQRLGSRKHRDQINPLNYRGTIATGFEIQLPAVHGAIKVYAEVTDTYNNMGIATTSIVVIDQEAQQKKYLVPKVDLPFYVYKDNQDIPYTPSGHMGNYKAMQVDLNNKNEVHSGNTAIKISYTARDNWYGVGFVDPANDWGDILGGYDLTDAKYFSFWAKANDTNVKAKIGFGLIGADKPFPDTGKKSIDITLTTQWKKYTIKTKKLDMSCIRSGLVVFSSSNGFPHEIYIDDVVFE